MYVQSATCVYVYLCCIVLHWIVLVQYQYQYRLAHSIFSIPSFFLYITLFPILSLPSIHSSLSTITTTTDDLESEMDDGMTWTVDTDYHCGGSSIDLEDNTVYGWIPSSEGETIDTCKTRCVTDPSCTAFVFRDSDLGCFLKAIPPKKL